jgi:hypothetical protein
MRLFALATLLLIAPVLMGAGAVIYSDKEGEGIEIWTFPSGGSFSKTGEFSDDGAMSLPGGKRLMALPMKTGRSELIMVNYNFKRSLTAVHLLPQSLWWVKTVGCLLHQVRCGLKTL